MSLLLTDPSTEVVLSVTLGDGASDQFPKASVIDAGGSVVATVDLTHAANGTYVGSYTAPAFAQKMVVNYTIYRDAARTLVSHKHDFSEDVLFVGPDEVVKALIAALPTGVWSIAESTTFPTNSMGFVLKLLKGSMGKANLRIDKMTYDIHGFLRSAKMRVFPDAATASSSTSRASGDASLEGALVEIDLSGVADGTHLALPSTMLGVVTTP